MSGSYMWIVPHCRIIWKNQVFILDSLKLSWALWAPNDALLWGGRPCLTTTHARARRSTESTRLDPTQARVRACSGVTLIFLVQISLTVLTGLERSNQTVLENVRYFLRSVFQDHVPQPVTFFCYSVFLTDKKTKQKEEHSVRIFFLKS